MIDDADWTRRPMQTHRLKTWPSPFQGIADGKKHHEVRRDDRGFEVGDYLVLEEWDQFTKEYTGRRIVVEVTWISRGPDWGLPPGLVVMSLDKPRDVRKGRVPT